MKKTNDSVFRKLNRYRLRFADKIVIILYIFFLIVKCDCETKFNDSSQYVNETKIVNNIENNLESNNCHSCENSNLNQDYITKEKVNNEEMKSETFMEEVIDTISTFTKKYIIVNQTESQLENEFEKVLDNALSKDRYEILEGIEIKLEDTKKDLMRSDKAEGRALFSTYTYEYRIYQKIKNFFETHILSINLPKAARLMGFRSFGLKKFFLPLIIGMQVFKSILLAMFLPSILGSFGKILGKGISQLSAASSQASYPPANTDDQSAYNDNKDFMGYDTNQAGSYAYPQEGLYEAMAEANDANDLSNVDMSRFGASGQKVSYLPSKNSYYKNQMSNTNNYKIFQKIPSSSVILSNYDPFYSPLLSRLDGIFARLGLAPSENSIDAGMGGQNVIDMKLESCREQLICLMYSSPAKYAPYSNLVSAQLSRELNELRRPVSDNPEILRFFRYMRAARRGQEGADCVGLHPACATATPSHTMIAAYHDINKLVTARKIRK
ncbi:PREDICTED: uncharacterized protein LOC106106784 [Papilio polytes]|uniref:uncharacterized protein LOC106106784 n=1 Tax=Papilio polytes TaxID=76194 RepID=UPI0006767674|nr:PREDICTED: uncharacterized protein LOC106106784 [Papilio polytes]